MKSSHLPEGRVRRYHAEAEVRLGVGGSTQAGATRQKG
jgi:hypothetical protein